MITGKPNVEHFLNGGDGTLVPAVAVATAPSVALRAKHVQLPAALLDDLKQRALEERKVRKETVTETQVIEAALRMYLATSV
jgi:hypothetical protein